MNHSLIGADRNTHLKIVVVALIAAIMVVAVGITARVADTSSLQASGPVIKAGQPTAVTTRDDVRVR
jgi:hypothetical protein